MLYSEFLDGINQTENKWNYEEYNRINDLYMNSDTMTKEEAYRLYEEPSQLVKDLMEEKNTYKAEMITARAAYKTEHEEPDKTRRELGEARAQILRLESELRRYQRAAHDLYYATGTI